MRTITVYHKDGSKSVITDRKVLQHSYDSTIDKPMHQSIMEGYYALECQGKLKDRDTAEFGGKAGLKRLHERCLERDLHLCRG